MVNGVFTRPEPFYQVVTLLDRLPGIGGHEISGDGLAWLGRVKIGRGLAWPQCERTPLGRPGYPSYAVTLLRVFTNSNRVCKSQWSSLVFVLVGWPRWFFSCKKPMGGTMKTWLLKNFAPAHPPCQNFSKTGVEGVDPLAQRAPQATIFRIHTTPS